jgi:hypothetical protein
MRGGSIASDAVLKSVEPCAFKSHTNVFSNASPQQGGKSGKKTVTQSGKKPSKKNTGDKKVKSGTKPSRPLRRIRKMTGGTSVLDPAPFGQAWNVPQSLPTAKAASMEFVPGYDSILSKEFHLPSVADVNTSAFPSYMKNMPITGGGMTVRKSKKPVSSSSKSKKVGRKSSSKDKNILTDIQKQVTRQVKSLLKKMSISK